MHNTRHRTYHVQQVSGVLQELAAKDENEVGAVTDLFFLHVRCQNQELGSRVLDLLEQFILNDVLWWSRQL